MACLAAMCFASTGLAQSAVPSPATPDASPTPATPPPTRAAPAPPSDVDWVELTLVTDDLHVSAYAKDERKVTVGDEVADSWTFVCHEPCDLRVDPRRTYRVMGESLVPSVEFHLAPGSGKVAIAVRPEHPSSSAVTATLVSVGAVTVVGGALFLLLDLAEQAAASSLVDDGSGSKQNLESRASTFGEVGGGMILGGVVVAGIGLTYALVSGGKTQLAPARTAGAARHDGLRPIPFGFAF